MTFPLAGSYRVALAETLELEVEYKGAPRRGLGRLGGGSLFEDGLTNRIDLGHAANAT